ncbi:tRNA (adenine-N1)-methyltransferase [Euzebya rosea]|uniref:tRNA (adenine-N1)-methyltransferase n=1 Tax=Euzebya rosea TaxID=2052804 RepID=UPI001F0C28C6|nr:tRNA (adenine-N1)-methyltransferase [Euzebya rosea]
MIRHAGHPDPLSVGDTVILMDRKGRRFMFELEEGKDYHFHRGIIRHDQLIGQPEGSTVVSTMSAKLTAVRPTTVDWTLKAPRGAQVVYPKDQAMIVTLGDVVPGSTVIEAGAGSGALTCALLRAVGPEGRVISYELREDHAEVALANVTRRMGGHPENWSLTVADLAEALTEHRCDRLVLDMLEPWAHVDAAANAVHPGGMLIAYTPTVTQVMRLREVLDADPRWGLTQTSETMHRTWHVDGLAVRPDHRMVAHTAFLTTARRMVPLEAPEDTTGSQGAAGADAEPAEDAPVGPRPGQLP